MHLSFYNTILYYIPVCFVAIIAVSIASYMMYNIFNYQNELLFLKRIKNCYTKISYNYITSYTYEKLQDSFPSVKRVGYSVTMHSLIHAKALGFICIVSRGHNYIFPRMVSPALFTPSRFVASYIALAISLLNYS